MNKFTTVVLSLALVAFTSAGPSLAAEPFRAMQGISAATLIDEELQAVKGQGYFGEDQAIPFAPNVNLATITEANFAVVTQGGGLSNASTIKQSNVAVVQQARGAGPSHNHPAMEQSNTALLIQTRGYKTSNSSSVGQANVALLTQLRSKANISETPQGNPAGSAQGGGRGFTQDGSSIMQSNLAFVLQSGRLAGG